MKRDDACRKALKGGSPQGWFLSEVKAEQGERNSTPQGEPTRRGVSIRYAPRSQPCAVGVTLAWLNMTRKGALHALQALPRVKDDGLGLVHPGSAIMPFSWSRLRASPIEPFYGPPMVVDG